MMKYVLITGATSGIGLATAKLLAEKGFHLAICGGHREDNLIQAKKELSSYPVQVLTYLGDCGDPVFAEDMMTDILRHFPHLDCVINNAGISYVGLLTDMTVDQWRQVMGTNLDALFYVSRLAIPSMISRKKGRILNISSMWGESGASCEVAYSASKGGVNSFTKALAKELAPSGIQVNAISFGTIDTRMNHCFTEEERQALAEEIPAGRFGTCEEAAQMIYQLMTAPDYLTGQVIRMDGAYL